MSDHLRPFSAMDLMELTAPRAGETKLGQRLRVAQSTPGVAGATELAIRGNLQRAAEGGARFGIVTVPEDVGPRANCGRGGADEGPRAFLKFFSNLQDNRFLDGSTVVAVGEVRLFDIQEQSKGAEVDKLRALCAMVDERVQAAVQLVFDCGLEPIVVGGGNNNSLPILRALRASNEARERKKGAAVINCDPHADFRRVEDGRHSGNPFSFAHREGALDRYCVFGLHEGSNSEDMLARMETAGFKHFTYESSIVRREESMQDQMEEAIRYLKGDDDCDVGMEVDLDSIVKMPASAKTNIGLTPEQAAHLVYLVTSETGGQVRYLHLSEGAPRWSGEDDGVRVVGQVSALLAATYIKARIGWIRRTGKTMCDENTFY